VLDCREYSHGIEAVGISLTLCARSPGCGGVATENLTYPRMPCQELRICLPSQSTLPAQAM
jgi:hypothetical protein